MLVEYRVLIIYDISQTKKRNKLVKILNSFGIRVQKSAFEAMLNQQKIKSLICKLKDFPLGDNESIRVYKFVGDDCLYWIKDISGIATLE